MRYIVWVAMGIVTLVMLGGGSAKVFGQEAALKSFTDLGFPIWFGIFVGVAELCGAVGIWLRRTSMLAAIGISIVMLGAIYYHFAFPPISSAAPAALVLAICGYIISRRGTGVVL